MTSNSSDSNQMDCQGNKLVSKLNKCRILFNNFIPSIEERCMYSDLFLLKNMEILVKEMNSSKEVNLSIKEHLLISATDMVECLRTDPSKVILLNFYLGNTEESSAIWLRIATKNVHGPEHFW